MENTSLLEKIRLADSVYVIGNGGSAANAEHIVNDLLSARVRAFNINNAFFSATANDVGYSFSFSRWVEVVGRKGDLLIALSGSGTSPNILKALSVAAGKGMDTHLVTDYLKNRDMQQSEEDQLVLGHNIMRMLRDQS